VIVSSIEDTQRSPLAARSARSAFGRVASRPSTQRAAPRRVRTSRDAVLVVTSVPNLRHAPQGDVGGEGGLVDAGMLHVIVPRAARRRRRG
jgi:hypothetical protein